MGKHHIMMGDPQQIRVAESPNLSFTQPEYLAYGRFHQVLKVSLLVNLQVSEVNMLSVRGRPRQMLCMPLAQCHWRSCQFLIIIQVIQVELQNDESREVMWIGAKRNPQSRYPCKVRMIPSSHHERFAGGIALVKITILNEFLRARKVK